jgi:phage terminase small subunit
MAKANKNATLAQRYRKAIEGRPLTLKQRKFIDAYIGEANGNAYKSAKLAGYRGNTSTLVVIASQNLRKPAIRAAIDEVMQNDPLAVSREETVRMLGEMAHDPTTEKRDKISALATLRKLTGDFIERREVKQTTEVRRAADLEDHELLRIILTDEKIERKVLEIVRESRGEKEVVAEFVKRLPPPIGD